MPEWFLWNGGDGLSINWEVKRGGGGYDRGEFYCIAFVD